MSIVLMFLSLKVLSLLTYMPVVCIHKSFVWVLKNVFNLLSVFKELCHEINRIQTVRATTNLSETEN